MCGLELLSVMPSQIVYLFYPHWQLAAIIRAVVPLISENHKGVVIFISDGSSYTLRTLSVKKKKESHLPNRIVDIVLIFVNVILVSQVLEFYFQFLGL